MKIFLLCEYFSLFVNHRKECKVCKESGIIIDCEEKLGNYSERNLNLKEYYQMKFIKEYN